MALPRRRSLSFLSLHLKSIGGATEKKEGKGGREEKEREEEGGRGRERRKEMKLAIR